METTVYIHGGDYDCSELVRMCYRAVDVLPYGSYCWTGNEVSLLKSHGFKERSLSSPQMGDVLWRSGHTEIYLGDGMEGGARVSETGGINGKKGDQTGGEITRSAYNKAHWTKLLRYEGGKTCDGIPAAIVAAKVADHIIDHSSHGYSQPNRAGDGTIEAVKVTWSESAPTVQDYELIKVDVIATVRHEYVNIRSAPSTKTGEVVGTYKRGAKVVLDRITFNDGRVWGSYVGLTSGKRRFIALADCTYCEVG